MHILDRYVARYFLSSLVIATATLALLFVLIDVVLHLDHLVGAEGGFLRAFIAREATQLPLVFQRFGSFVTLAAALFAVARLESNNELVPMLSSGISVPRALAPVLVGALLLGGVEAAMTEWLIPSLADTIRAEGALGAGEGRRPGFLRDDRGSTLFAGGYDPATETLRWVTFRERDEDERLVRTLFGDRAVWVSGSSAGGAGASGASGASGGGGGAAIAGWRLEAGWERLEAPADRAEGAGAPSTPRPPASPLGPSADAPALLRPLPAEGVRLDTTILPIDVESLNERFSLLRFGELRRQAYERQRYLTSLRVQLLARFTGPLAHVLLCLLGIPLVLGVRGKASLALSVLALLGIAALYFLVTFLSHELGANDTLPPWAAASLPAALAGLGSVVLWLRVRS